MHLGSAPKSVAFTDGGDNRVAVRVGDPAVATLGGGGIFFSDGLTGARRIVDPTGETFTVFVLRLHMEL